MITRFPNLDRSTPGARLRAARMEAGATMGEVARALVLSVVDVSDAERQKGNGLFHPPSWIAGEEP